MLNYVQILKEELLEQFRGKANIEALVEVLGEELQQVYAYLVQLRDERHIQTAVGKQLDGVGDIVDMTRADVYKYISEIEPTDLLDDEIYRQYLIYKIIKNTSNCTYKEIIKAFKMFWDRPLYYREDPNEPATMIFDTGIMEGTVDTSPLFRTPLIRPAGVTLKLFAQTSTEMERIKFHLMSGLGYANTVTDLPILERNINYGYTLRVGVSTQSIAQSSIPPLEPGMTYKVSLNKGRPVQSVMETPLGGAKLQT